MLEVRFANKGEISRQKEIWKLCFGDHDDYINFYYANRYREEETVLLLKDGEISAMFTMIPVKTVMSDKHRINTVMIYAVATHPKKQNRGFASSLMNFCDQYLKLNKQDLSILVPAKEHLFNYYRKRGYQNGFYIREVRLTRDMINNLPIHKSSKCTISSVIAEEYNQIRNKQLSGRLHIAYDNEDIKYQKGLSVQSGADIYGITYDNVQGCAAVERASSDKVFIKEMLLHEKMFNKAIKLIAQQLYAKEYILRTPVYLADHLGGTIRPLAMVKIHREIDLLITPDEHGYLGFAFD